MRRSHERRYSLKEAAWQRRHFFLTIGPMPLFGCRFVLPLTFWRRLLGVGSGLFGPLFAVQINAAEMPKDAASQPVSFYKDIRPIFQANCHGCHQPAKAKGGYVMTEFQKLVA